MRRKVEEISNLLDQVHDIQDLDFLIRKINDRKNYLLNIADIRPGRYVSFQTDKGYRAFGTVVKICARYIHIRVNSGVVWKAVPSRVRIEK